LRIKVKKPCCCAFSLVSLALSALWAPPLFAQTGADSPQNEARPFIEQASRALAAGSVSQASAFLVSAIELAPDYSEALFVRAEVELRDRAATLQAEADLRAALKSASWSTTDPSAAAQALAETLLRTGKLAEARALIQPLEAAHPEDSRNALLLARLLVAGGETAAANRTLTDALLTFPLVDELRLASARLLVSQGRASAARDLIATGLKVHPDSLPLLLAAARLERDGARKLAAIALYSQKGGNDPEAPLIGLETATANRAKYLDSFLSQGGLARQDLVTRAAAAVKSSKSLSSSLQTSLSGYRGNRDLDADADGFWEERWTFDNGSPTSWRREPSQDGRALYSAQFVGGQPSSFVYSPAPDAPVTLKFAKYPAVESATAAPGWTYLLVPYTLTCAFLRASPAGSLAGLAPLALARAPTLTLDQLQNAAYGMEQRAADGVALVRRVVLGRGKRVFMEEDENGDGVLDHRVWYVNGAPVRGERSLADNGPYPVLETWRDGKIAVESVDTDGDGKPDFRQTFGASPMKAWDWNEDGTDDSRELPGPGGSVVREFSLSLDGIFDLRMVLQGSSIKGMSLRGAPVAVVPDPTRGVTWIGQPAADGARIDLSQPDGIQIVGGSQYLVFHYGGVVYAEVSR
jgi:tetratricopeptide (TPR) repeat protein